MKTNFEKQFENIKGTLRKNITDIKSLLKDLEEIDRVIEEISTNSADQIEIKNSLIDIKQKISSSIDSLIANTKALFEAYDLLLKQLFGT